MGLFNGVKRKAQQPFQQPHDFGGVQMNDPGDISRGTGIDQFNAPQIQKPKFFDSDGGWRNVLGALGDAAQTFGGGRATYAQGQQAQEQERQRQSIFQQTREADLQDYERKQQIQARYATPRVNDTVEDYNFIKTNLGEEGARKYLQNRADPPRYVQMGDGRYVPVGGGMAPQAPVGKLKPYGGAGPQTPSTFP